MKSKRRQQSRLSYKNTRRRHKGGEPFASGGYGCVFSPALKCANSSKRKPNTVSKLMLTSNAKSEYTDIVLIKKHLNKIPNVNNYFMLSNITMCSPAKLTSSDLHNFNKCRALTKHSITKHNINNNLHKLSILNLPHGGLPVDDYISSYAVLTLDVKKSVVLINSLMKLITHAIIPMNRANIYHTDIKDSNILVQEISNQKLRTRIIDWGLAVKYIPTKSSNISEFARPFQFNVPFTCIIFSEKFRSLYKSFVEKGHISKSSIKTKFVMPYIDMLIKQNKASHFKYIQSIIEAVYINSDSNPTIPHLTKHIISNYISNVLYAFTGSDIDLTFREYAHKIYIKNVDIWGIIVTHYPLLLYLQQYSYTNVLFKPAHTLLSNIFKTYLYSINEDDNARALKPIDINELLSDLKTVGHQLNTIGTKHMRTITSNQHQQIARSISQSIALNKSPSALI